MYGVTAWTRSATLEKSSPPGTDCVHHATVGQNAQASMITAQTCEGNDGREDADIEVAATRFWVPPITVGPVKRLWCTSEASES